MLLGMDSGQEEFDEPLNWKMTCKLAGGGYVR